MVVDCRFIVASLDMSRPVTCVSDLTVMDPIAIIVP
jgi:hypothetical protein